MEQQKQFYTSQEAKPIIDPDLRDFLPPISDEERENLKADILQNGCYSPLICMEDMTLVDGHHRYAICEELDKPYNIHVIKFEDKLAAKEWMVNTQKGRRNLTVYQLGQIALRLKPEFEERARKNKLVAIEKARAENGKVDDFLFCRKSDKTEISPTNTLKSLAEAIGVNRDTMSKVNQIDEKAPDIIKGALEQDLISVNRAYQMTKEIEALPEEQREERAQELVKENSQKTNRRITSESKEAKKLLDLMQGLTRLDPSSRTVAIFMHSCGLDAHNARLYAERAQRGSDKLLELADNFMEIYEKRKDEIEDELERHDVFEG